jgi:hypothetical protein
MRLPAIAGVDHPAIMLDEAPLEALPFINIIGAGRPRSQQPKAAQPGRMDQATPHHR